MEYDFLLPEQKAVFESILENGTKREAEKFLKSVRGSISPRNYKVLARMVKKKFRGQQAAGSWVLLQKYSFTSILSAWQAGEVCLLKWLLLLKGFFLRLA